MNDHEKKLALYDSWANKMVLRSMDSLPAWDEKVTRLVGHLVAAKEVWMARIRLIDTAGRELWPTVTPLEAAKRIAAADADLIALTVQRADLKSAVTYKTMKGDTWSTPIRDIIVHMVNHATYHRGQIATAVKAAGGQPAATDFILYTREFPNGQAAGPL